jgi:hypothetical protein
MVATRRSQKRTQARVRNDKVAAKLLQLASALPADSGQRTLVLVTASKLAGSSGSLGSAALLLAAADALLGGAAGIFAATPEALLGGPGSPSACARAGAAVSFLKKVEVMLEGNDSERAFALMTHAYRLEETAFLVLKDYSAASDALSRALSCVSRRECLLSSGDSDESVAHSLMATQNYFLFRSLRLEAIASLQPMHVMHGTSSDIAALSRHLQAKFHKGFARESTAGILLGVQQHRLGLACGEILNENGSEDWPAACTALYNEIEQLLVNWNARSTASGKMLWLANIVLRGYGLVRSGDTIGSRNLTVKVQQALSVWLRAKYGEDDDWHWMASQLVRSLVSNFVSAAYLNVKEGKLSLKHAQEALKLARESSDAFDGGASNSGVHRMTEHCPAALVLALTHSVTRCYISTNQLRLARETLGDGELEAHFDQQRLFSESELAQGLLSAEISSLEGSRKAACLQFNTLSVALRNTPMSSDLKAVVAIYLLLEVGTAALPRIRTTNGNILAGLEFAQGYHCAKTDPVRTKELYKSALTRTSNEQIVANILVQFSTLFESHAKGVTPAALNLAVTGRTLAKEAEGDSVLLLRAARQIAKLLSRTRASPQKKSLSSQAESDIARTEAAVMQAV